MKVEFSYKNGRVRAMAERDARVLQKLGKGSYLTCDLRSQVRNDSEDELTALRVKYQEVVGKKAYHGWTADDLSQKIAEHGEN